MEFDYKRFLFSSVLNLYEKLKNIYIPLLQSWLHVWQPILATKFGNISQLWKIKYVYTNHDPKLSSVQMLIIYRYMNFVLQKHSYRSYQHLNWVSFVLFQNVNHSRNSKLKLFLENFKDKGKNKKCFRIFSSRPNS